MNNRLRLFLPIKKLLISLTSPHHTISDKFTLQKVRFLISIIITGILLLAVLVLSRMTQYFILQNHSVFSEMILGIIIIILGIGCYLTARSRYFNLALYAVITIPLIQPWFSINVYLTNPNANDILINATLVLGLDIVLSGLLFRDYKILLLTIICIIDLVLFYGVILRYPIEWLLPKMLFLLIIASFAIMNSNFGIKTFNKALKHTKELETSQKRYKTLYETTRIGLVTADSSGTITSANPAALKIMGYNDIKDLLNKKSIEFYANLEDREILMQEVLEKGFIDNYQLLMKRKDGSQAIIQISATVIKDEEGNIVNFETTMRDITEEKIAKKIRKDLEVRQSDFISLTSHELRTPLSNIKGYFDIIRTRGEYLSPEAKVSTIEAIDRNIKRLERLITGVNELTLIERGIFELQIRISNFFDFINNFIQQYFVVLGDQLKYSIFPDDHPAFVKLDPHRLTQALDNLIQNAIKHTPENERHIIIQVESLPKKVKFTIRDNGAGVAPENLDKIFDSFVVIPSIYSVQGTGISLNLTKSIVEAHNGVINAFSEGLNKGSTFVIELPRVNSNSTKK